MSVKVKKHYRASIWSGSHLICVNYVLGKLSRLYSKKVINIQLYKALVVAPKDALSCQSKLVNAQLHTSLQLLPTLKHSTTYKAPQSMKNKWLNLREI